MNLFLQLYFISLPVCLVFDMLWITVIAKQFYAHQIGSLLKPNVNWAAAIIFYLLFLAGLVVFVILPAYEKRSWMHALGFGMLFGLVCYSTYDLTNLALAKDWPLLVTIVDMLWGAVLSGSVATITYLLITSR